MPRLFDRDWPRAELQRKVGALAQLFGVEAAEYTDGPARGLRFLEVRTGGGLRLVLLPDRCLDIGAAEYAGTPLAWRSAVGPVHPALHTAGDRVSFQRSFGGGLLVTCGLRHFGPPLSTPGESFPTHGRAHSLPAGNIRWGTDWAGDEAVLWVEGTVREVRSGGENLELCRRFEFPVGGREMRLTDRITNLGHQVEPLAVLHHVNFGFPLVDEGARLTLNGESLSLPDLAATQTFGEPGGGVAVLWGSLVPTVVSLRFSHPSVYIWHNFSPGMNVVAVEPATHGEMGRPEPVVPQLAPGESVTLTLSLTVNSAA